VIFINISFNIFSILINCASSISNNEFLNTHIVIYKKELSSGAKDTKSSHTLLNQLSLTLSIIIFTFEVVV